MSTITTINGTDVISTSRTTINTNFSNLNTDKVETSYLDTDTSLTANSDSKIATQKAVKAYVDSGGNQNASTTARGIVEEATSAEIIAGTGAGATGARLFVNPTQVAETGADKIAKIKSTGFLDSSIISITMPFVTQDVAMFSTSSASAQVFATSTITGTVLYVAVNASTSTNVDIFRLLKDTTTGNYYITHKTTLTVSSNGLFGICATSTFLYVGATISGTLSMRRYALTDLSGVTSMTGTISTNVGMWSDGTNIYIGSGASTFDKYTISGTAITNDSTITYTSSAYNGQGISDGTNVYFKDTTLTGSVNIRKYPIAGGAATSTTTLFVYSNAYYNTITTGFLFLGSTTNLGIGWMYDISNPTTALGSLVHLFAITLP